jgi:hypothetical protein
MLGATRCDCIRNDRLSRSTAMTVDACQPWDRRPRESSRAYAAFRAFRDLGPLRTFDDLVTPDRSRHSLRMWSARHDGAARAAAWDDELHRAADVRRLEAIREMHDAHARAGRMIVSKALAALAKVPVDEIPPYVAGRLLEVGARLERETLTVSVEQLQGRDAPLPDDPWEIIARELERVELPGSAR